MINYNLLSWFHSYRCETFLTGIYLFKVKMETSEQYVKSVKVSNKHTRTTLMIKSPTVNNFFPVFKFYFSRDKPLKRKSEDQLAQNWFIFKIFVSFGSIDFALFFLLFGHMFDLDIYFFRKKISENLLQLQL